mgnify:CR=1 FL=1
MYRHLSELVHTTFRMLISGQPLIMVLVCETDLLPVLATVNDLLPPPVLVLAQLAANPQALPKCEDPMTWARDRGRGNHHRATSRLLRRINSRWESAVCRLDPCLQWASLGLDMVRHEATRPHLRPSTSRLPVFPGHFLLVHPARQRVDMRRLKGSTQGQVKTAKVTMRSLLIKVKHSKVDTE